MSRSFLRQVQLTVVQPTAFFFVVPSQTTTVIRDLRVQFDVEKRLASKEPNKCEITISNLSTASRGIFAKLPLHVRLDAGYVDQLEQLFVGDVIHAQSYLRGTDWETKLQLADGARALGNARVNRSFRAGCSLRTCIGEVATSMGIRAPALDDAVFDRSFKSGVVLCGLAKNEMDRVLKPHGLDWSIQDGRLQILRATEARREAVLRLSPDTGLIGSPEYGAPERKGKPPLLTVTSLLKPSATPGGKVQVSSQAIPGDRLFKIKSVKHQGDTHGPDWKSAMEVHALPGAPA